MRDARYEARAPYAHNGILNHQPVNVKIVIFNFAFCSLLIVVQIRNIMYGDGTEEDQVTGTYNYNNATTTVFQLRYSVLFL